MLLPFAHLNYVTASGLAVSSYCCGPLTKISRNLFYRFTLASYPPTPHRQNCPRFFYLLQNSPLPFLELTALLLFPISGRNRKSSGRGPAAENVAELERGLGSGRSPCPLHGSPWLQAESRSGGGWARPPPECPGGYLPGPPGLRKGSCLQPPPLPPPPRLLPVT